MLEITCAICGALKMRNTGEVNRAIRNGAALYCSRACMGAAKRTEAKVPGWHQRRFEQREAPGIVESTCAECSRPMWLPASKVEMYKRCGPECNAAFHARTKAARTRPCETCGRAFTPRQVQINNGGGRFCSQACNTAGTAALQTDDAFENRMVRMRETRAAGGWRVLRGEDNPRWQGGKRAALDRRRDSGKAAAELRAYRAKNPHKVREFSQRRKGRKLGRLAYGSIPRIGALQKWKCAICRASLRKGYHLDHITPLAKGGQHIAANVQLLCGPCNLRKSDRDPIMHMQSLGRLL